MKYIIGLIMGIVLMTTWPQQTHRAFSNALEYIELGIDKVSKLEIPNTHNENE